MSVTIEIMITQVIFIILILIIYYNNLGHTVFVNKKYLLHLSVLGNVLRKIANNNFNYAYGDSLKISAAELQLGWKLRK